MWFNPTLLFTFDDSTSSSSNRLTALLEESRVSFFHLNGVAGILVFWSAIHLLALNATQLTLLDSSSMLSISSLLVTAQRSLACTLAVSIVVIQGVLHGLGASVLCFLNDLSRAMGFTELYASSVSTVNGYLSGTPFDVAGMQNSLFFAPNSDLDCGSATDFEDLLVFTLDALELLWQDVNLAVELCGDNALGLSFGLGCAGISWVSNNVFSTNRLNN